MKFAKPVGTALAALMLSVPVLDAQAALTAVDPGPYVADNGFFPAWYQDAQGVTLDLCLSKAISSRVAGVPGTPSYMCTLLPNPGIFDDALPIVFPTNFPDEAFWFLADGLVQTQGIPRLRYVAGLEAAFAGGVPLANDQVSFARIRITADVDLAGTYTITHPYGVEIVNVATPGKRAITLTRDVGIGAPGVFTGALAGDIGPFLRGVGGPYQEVNPVTNVLETFIGDPNLLEQVTGSPFGTNFLRVQGPNGIDVQSDLFAVSGKLSTVATPATPLVIERSTYSRVNTPAGVLAQQDVFVTAPITATVTAADSEGTPVVMTDDDDNSGWYGQSFSNPTVLPDVVSVSASNVGNTPANQTSNLVDLVTITRAEYAAGTLTVEAVSSDEVELPALTVNGVTMNLVGAGPLKSAVISGLTIPPAFVTVTSARLGSDTEDVVVLP